MHNLILSEDDVEKELQVIIEERRMRTENEPRALLREQLYAALFQNHTYGNPVIGWMHEMEGLTREDALKHYETYYAPNNAILVVAGDVSRDEVKKLAQKYYGRLKKSNLKKRLEIMEPPQRVARSLVMEDERVKDSEWWRVYYAPSYNQDKTEMYYPLVVLSKILGEGNLSRLYQRLVVEKKIATVVGTSYSGLSRGPGDFTIYALPAKAVDVSALEEAINEEIADIVKNGINPDELNSAKKTLIADEIYAKEGLQSLAFAVGELIATGADPDYITTWSDRVNAVSADEIQQAAQYVFDKKNSVTGVLKNGK
jgi:zinc protease